MKKEYGSEKIFSKSAFYPRRREDQFAGLKK
jgi:hypothetical protein